MMTPGNEKVPLPDPTVNPGEREGHPTTYLEWKLTLARLRVMLENRHFKECAIRCEQVISNAKVPPHPIHTAAVHFYRALSNELLARALHNLSISKLPLLNSAKASYASALSSLPNVELAYSSPESRCLGENGGPDHNAASSPRLPLLESPTPVARFLGRAGQLKSPRGLASPPRFWPSPLYFEKNKSTPIEACEVDIQGGAPESPKRFSVAFSDSTTEWLHERPTGRLNAHLEGFGVMLAQHIESVDDLAKSIKEAQMDRHNGHCLVADGEDESTKTLNRRERIKQLKAKGWERERFNPEKYRFLCKKALAEL